MVTWLASVAMVASVVMGVAREAVTVPKVDTPAETDTHTDDATPQKACDGQGVSDQCPPVVPLTTSVVTVGLAAPDTRLTPPIGTVLRMVPGVPGAPFNTTLTQAHT